MSTAIKALGYVVALPFACFGFWCSFCIDVFNKLDRDFDAYIEAKREAKP